MPDQTFFCTSCGAEYAKWSGKCEACGEWNTIKEFKGAPKTKSRIAASGSQPADFSGIKASKVARRPSGIREFDRVLGGGIVPGSVLLLCGDPGIGKSTLLLQLAAKDNWSGGLLYASGEESAEQVRLRADRLGIVGRSMKFLTENDIDALVNQIAALQPSLVIVDSIQTLSSANLPSAAGSVAQVKDAAEKLIGVAKSQGIPIIIVGHVTKGGTVAGPKTLEHLVDAVLYLEGDRYHDFRILKGIKNRFGSVNETGIFRMSERGFAEVTNPSEIFLQERQALLPGTAVGATFEGSRALLIEIQALVNHTDFEYPRRSASGFDFNRLQLLIAVLSKRAGLALGGEDVYLNITGGIKVADPALDLPAGLAIASACKGKPVREGLVAIGEIGLSGEIRSVPRLEQRIKEAEAIGFQEALVPAAGMISKNKIKISHVKTVREAFKLAFK